MSAATTTEPFSLTGALPEALTVLEASAGTGKTFALAALATRFVAEEGLTASQLCIVSFTEAATAELRGRVRSRLAQAADHLAAGGAPVDDDEVLTALGAVDDAERARRVGRLERALADFDSATISTIPGFCSRVVAAGREAAATPITADDGDVAEVVGDVYLARYGGGRPAPAELPKLVQAVEARLGLADARMALPDDQARAGRYPERVALLEEVAALVDELVDAVLERRAHQRRRTFDSLLTDARELLGGPHGAAAVAALRARFGIVLIDEFQDTDQVQWDIFRTAFLDGDDPVRVVLVGDPKQSIYRFRGAELSAYLAARDFAEATGGRRATLDVNRRSDKPLLDALERIFGGYEFGDPTVAFAAVQAADAHAPSPLDAVGAGDAAPLQVRCVGAEVPNVGEARARVLPDLVAEVIRLLNTAWITDKGGRRRLKASDIGVLVRSNADASRYADALSAAGVSAASSSSDSVLESPAANEWRILLAALERPTSPGPVRAAILGWFVGLPATQLDALSDEALGEHMDRFRRWAARLSDRGLPGLLGELRAAGLAPRVLSRVGGERDLTDLDHIAELLQSATGGRPIGPSGLLAALTALGAQSPFGSTEDPVAPELLARRIDRDDDTVKVLTVHMAKGLEFPVVLCPTLWAAPGGKVGVKHAWDGRMRRIDTNSIAVPGTGSGSKDFTGIDHLDKLERDGESRRLLYVALTRAKHRLVLWWYRPHQGKPPLGGLLGHACGLEDGAVDIDVLVATSGGCIARADVATPAPHLVLASHDDAAPPVLEVASADRRLEDRWRIWSFTAVQGAAVARATAPSPAPPVLGGNDERTEAAGADDELVLTDLAGAPPGGAGTSLLLRDVPGGTAFGTLVHAVLERTDFAAADLHDELRIRCAEGLQRRRLSVTPDHLAEGLLAALRAPLGGPVGERHLAELSRADRLDELGFDLPLAGFDATDLAAVLADHLPADDPLRPWVEQAAAGGLRVEVAGWLTGSIDLVARCSIAGTTRYWLADYKTNRLPDGSDYGQDDLVGAMEHHGYPLQATLYLVALHRYLRRRLEGYEPDRDLVGAAYLFLRGMDPGRSAGDTRGVLWWRPPTAALDELDALFADGARP
ncbi:MAG: UvrD-helicase domain-containing protein [Acidimicrobiales bacterium]